MSRNHREYRCQECNKLMFKGIMVDSQVEVKCKKYGSLNLFQGESISKYICLTENCPSRIAVNFSDKKQEALEAHQ